MRHNELVELKKLSIIDRQKQRELEIEKAKNEQSRRAQEHEKELARIKLEEESQIKRDKYAHEKEIAKINARKAEEERIKAEEERRQQELRIERYSTILSGADEIQIDFKTEIARALRPFVSKSGEYAQDRGAICNANGETALRAEYVRLLRMQESGLRLNKEAWTNLIVGAVAVGSVKVFKRAFAEVNSLEIVSSHDPLRRTPLLWALSGGNGGLIDLVWSGHPNCCVVDALGRTPLHYAVQLGAAREVEICLKLEPAIVNAADNEGETPIYLAIANSRLDIATMLLDAKANLNHRRKDGCTPFKFASRKGEIAFLELFEQYGMRPTSVDFAAAVEGGHLETVRWFVEKRFFSVEGILGHAVDDSAVKTYLLTQGATN